MNATDFRYRHPRLTAVIPWLLFFALLLLSLRLVTQNIYASQLILLGLLITIGVNLSLPPSVGSVGIVPLVGLSSLFILGDPVLAVGLFAISYALAEIVRPLWYGLYDRAGVERPSLGQQLGLGIVYLLALLAAIAIMQTVDGRGDESGLITLAIVSLSYSIAYLLFTFIWWMGQKRPFFPLFKKAFPSLLITGLGSAGGAIIMSIAYEQSGLPALVIFAFASFIFSLLLWNTWERKFLLDQQLQQIARFNRTGQALRATLDLETVITQTYTETMQLVGMDAFTLALQTDDGGWQFSHHPRTNIPFRKPDDFMEWVLQNGRLLNVERSDLHFVRQHGLIPPEPMPSAWLGLPIEGQNDNTVGVLVLQRHAPHPPFSGWERQVLIAVAGQASAAIQNAQLHQETVRLYNLTDAALAQRLNQLQALLNGMDEGVLLLDMDGNIALMNPMATRLLDNATSLHTHPFPTTAAQGMGFSTDEAMALWTALRAGKTPSPRQQLFQNGRLHIERNETAVTNSDGVPIGWLMLFRDVTEAEQLAEKRTDLTNMIVHDLRNPITTLMSAIHLSQRHLQDGNRAAIDDWLANADHSANDMLDMVDSLMDINRMDAGQAIVEAEAMRLPPLIDVVLARLQPLATKKRIMLTYAPPANLPAVWGDGELLRRMLVNLLDNALKFTPENGRITITLSPEIDETGNSDDGLRCAISDTGPGVAADAQALIFDRFMRTNQGGAQVRGTGLGLTFCKMVIDGHNGRLWVENTDEGSSFIFTLPGIPHFEL